jgi:hypothetical protein
MVLGNWLQMLGLGQYEAAFRDDASLTSEDLKDLGKNLVGTRRKLLNAIAALGVDARRRRSSARGGRMCRHLISSITQPPSPNRPVTE